MTCNHIPFRSWFFIACAGQINDNWPHVHLYEASATGIGTPLTDAQIDRIVKHMRADYAGVPLKDVAVAFLGKGGVVAYVDPPAEVDLRIVLVDEVTEAYIASQATEIH